MHWDPPFPSYTSGQAGDQDIFIYVTNGSIYNGDDPELAEYSITQLKKQTNPELKVFVTYYPGGG